MILNEVMDLRAYVTGFRGDWKALKQTFNFARYADKDEAQVYCPVNEIHTNEYSLPLKSVLILPT